MHPSDDQLERYLAGTLTTDEEHRIDAHIDVCQACRTQLSDVVRQRFNEKTLLRSPLPEEGLPVQVGSVVTGRFRIERLLGVGGMGCVFEAHHLQLNRPVALKFMLPQYARDRTAVDRFVREARAAVRLVTEHVGRVLDLGALDDGCPFLIMELLAGETVEQRLAREGPFPAPVAIDVVQQLLLALGEAHGLGIVHRDLKPANLFLARRANGTEVVKVLDFGIAKSIHPDIEAGLSATSRQMLLGSPLYMAPEQLSPGQPVDARVDLWAVGCTLYQLLAGEPPFPSRDLVELMYSIQKKPHPRLASFNPGLRAFDPIIDVCLAKNPDDRVSSAADLGSLLEALKTEPSHDALAGARRNWSPAVFAAVALVLTAAAAGWLLPPRSEAPPPPREAAALTIPVAQLAPSLPSPPNETRDSDAGLTERAAAPHPPPRRALKSARGQAPASPALVEPSSVDPLGDRL